MDSLNAYLQKISEQNRIRLGDDDPVLILHTFFEKFLDDLRDDFKSFSEELASRNAAELKTWENASKERATRVITLALENAQRLARKQYDEQAQNFFEAVTKALDAALLSRIERLESENRRSWHLAIANMIAGGFLCLAIVLWYLVK